MIRLIWIKQTRATKKSMGCVRSLWTLSILHKKRPQMGPLVVFFRMPLSVSNDMRLAYEDLLGQR